MVPLDDDDTRLLEVVARLPLAPLTIVATFAGGGRASIYRRLNDFFDRGLVAAVANPWRARGRPPRLLYATRLGLEVLAQRRAIDWHVLARDLMLERVRPTRWTAELPGRLAAYQLLQLLASAHSGAVTLVRWEGPWRRVIETSVARRGPTTRMVRLPAAATLSWASAEGRVTSDYLLLPDTGGLAIPAVRTTLGRLAEYQAARPESPATLIIATTTARRAVAWTRLLESASSGRGMPNVAGEVQLWEGLRRPARARRHTALSRPRPGARRLASAPSTRGGSAPRPRAGTVLGPVVNSNGPYSPAPVVSRLDVVVLDLVGRHPFLSTENLAAALGRDVGWVRRKRSALVSRGLMRMVPAEEMSRRELAERELLELTRTGLEALAGHLGLLLGEAVRRHGLAGGGPADPVGTRESLLRYLEHTLGADAVFASLARAAASHPTGGALVEWRAAAACARGRFRPDGYGLLRLGRERRGFFLEFDRGTIGSDQLRAKFVAYHRYQSSGHASVSFAGFPVLLIVASEPGAEQRLVRALRAAELGQGAQLSAYLTTTGFLESAPGGPLGAVWRTVGDPTRREAWA